MEIQFNDPSELRDHIKTRLVFFANWYAHSRGYRFGYGADTSLIPDLCSDAASKIVGHNLPPPVLELTIRDSEKKLKKFIDRLIKVRSDIYRDDPINLEKNVIGELTFSEARQWFCPLWPFCD